MTSKIDIDRFFEQFDGTRKQASVDAVFGTPVEANGKTVIPIASTVSSPSSRPRGNDT